MLVIGVKDISEDITSTAQSENNFIEKNNVFDRGIFLPFSLKTLL